MEDQILKRLAAVEKGLKQTHSIRVREMKKMRDKVQTLATKDDLAKAMENVVHKEDLDKMGEMFMPRADIVAFQATVATKDDLKAVITEVQAVGSSVSEVAKLQKNFKIGVHVGGKVFGISGRFLLWLGVACTSIIAINTVFHSYIVAFFRWWIH